MPSAPSALLVLRRVVVDVSGGQRSLSRCPAALHAPGMSALQYLMYAAPLAAPGALAEGTSKHADAHSSASSDKLAHHSGAGSSRSDTSSGRGR